MSENLKEAKLSMTKWINDTAEDSMSDIQIDDETGKTFRFDWDDAFERAVEDAYQDISDWVNDYELTYEEQTQLENWCKGLRSDTFQRELDKLEEARKEADMERYYEARLGLI